MIQLIFKVHKKTDKIFFHNFFYIYKNVNWLLSKKQRKLSKKAPERYQNLYEEEKDKKWQYARERYRNLSKEETEKNNQYGRDRYKSLLEDEKQMLVEYKRN